MKRENEHSEPDEFRTQEFTPPKNPDAPPAPERRAKYELLKELGSGGYGTVYLAQQTRPVNRQVAVKVANLQKFANRARQTDVVRDIMGRFMQERQALAMMDHENIAQIFDAGKAANGQPFFVMEYVDGLPLNQFCDRQRFKLRERLELLLKVCDAVQHAHQKGIIHRDLKPGNILVTKKNGKPIPKVIDFGMAKALDPRVMVMEGDAIQTQTGNPIGTWFYMSPEQVCSQKGETDIRSDVFSLGVILYELITGKTPLQVKPQGTRIEIDFVSRIRDEEAQRPSQYLRQAGVPQVSRLRSTTPERLIRDVQGDLDQIVMNALEKNREDRYQTVAEFADDIRRHLQDEPIRRQTVSGLYRAKKFIRKHRGWVIGSGLLFALLLVGCGILGYLVYKLQAESEILNGKIKTAQDKEKEAIYNLTSAKQEAEKIQKQAEDEKKAKIAEAQGAVDEAKKQADEAKQLAEDAKNRAKTANAEWKTALEQRDKALAEKVASDRNSDTFKKLNEQAESAKLDAQKAQLVAERTARELDEAFRKLDKSNRELVKSNAVQADLVREGSELALARGRDAWRADRPDEAVAHFCAALRMQPGNQAAAIWLYHSLANARQMEQIPAQSVFGGGPEVSRCLLSRNGRFVAVQQAADRRVSIRQTSDGREVRSPFEVLGSIEDFAPWGEGFRLLVLGQDRKRAEVVEIAESSPESRSVPVELPVNGCRFSETGRFLVDKNRRTRIYEIGANRWLLGDLALPSADTLATDALLSPDDLQVFVSDADGVEVKETSTGKVVRRWARPTIPDLPVPSETPPTPSSDEAEIAERLPLVPGLARTGLSRPVIAGVFGSQSAAVRGSVTSDRSGAGGPEENAALVLWTTRKGQADSKEVLGWVKASNSNPAYYQDSAYEAIFPASLRSWVSLKNSYSGGDGKWQVTLHNEEASQSHWYSAPFLPKEVSYDPTANRVILTDGPFPEIELIVLNFADLYDMPYRLELPIVDSPPNQVAGQFLPESNQYVAQVARNAVAVWPLRELAPPAREDLVEQRLIAKPETVSQTVERTLWKEESLPKSFGGGTTMIKLRSVDPERPTETKAAWSTSPKYGDGRKLNGSELLSHSFKSEPSSNSNSSGQQPDYSAYAGWKRGDKDTLLLQLYTGVKLRPLGNLAVQHPLGPSELDRLLLDRTGKYLVVQVSVPSTDERDRFPSAGAKASPRSDDGLISVLEKQTGFAPQVRIYALEQNKWLSDWEPGIFGGFDASGRKLMLANHGRVREYDLESGQFDPLSLPELPGVRLRALATDRADNLVAGVTTEGQLLVWNRKAGTLLARIHGCPIPDPKSLAPLLFGEQSDRVAVTVPLLSSDVYYASEPGCQQCGATASNDRPPPSRTWIVDLATKAQHWVENTPEVFSDLVVSQSPRGMEVSGFDWPATPRLGPLPNALPSCFVDRDRKWMTTVRRPVINGVTSTLGLVEVWDLTREVPAAPLLRLPPYTQVLQCEIGDRSVQILTFSAQTGFGWTEVPTYGSVADLDEEQGERIRAWSEAVSGRSIDKHGRFYDLRLEQRSRDWLDASPLPAEWRRLAEWLRAPPRSVASWPPAATVEPKPASDP